MFFNSKDRDRDGRISYEEFCDKETVNERAFKAMDLNRDGYITKSEMLKASNRISNKGAATRRYELSISQSTILFGYQLRSELTRRTNHSSFCLKKSTL